VPGRRSQSHLALHALRQRGAVPAAAEAPTADGRAKHHRHCLPARRRLRSLQAHRPRELCQAHPGGDQQDSIAEGRLSINAESQDRL